VASEAKLAKRSKSNLKEDDSNDKDGASDRKDDTSAGKSQ